MYNFEYMATMNKLFLNFEIRKQPHAHDVLKRTYTQLQRDENKQKQKGKKRGKKQKQQNQGKDKGGEPVLQVDSKKRQPMRTMSTTSLCKTYIWRQKNRKIYYKA